MLGGVSYPGLQRGIQQSDAYDWEKLHLGQQLAQGRMEDRTYKVVLNIVVVCPVLRFWAPKNAAEPPLQMESVRGWPSIQPHFKCAINTKW